MILTYGKDNFVDMVRNGSKIHSIIEDLKRRWKPGMSIQHWRGNPRHVRQNSYHFADGKCISIQEIVMSRPCKMCLNIQIDGRELLYNEVAKLAKNEGLTIKEFVDRFDPLDKPPFKGRIIHFTGFKY